MITILAGLGCAMFSIMIMIWVVRSFGSRGANLLKGHTPVMMHMADSDWSGWIEDLYVPQLSTRRENMQKKGGNMCRDTDCEGCRAEHRYEFHVGPLPVWKEE